MTFAIAKTRQHEFYPIWGAEVRRKMQINCRIIAEQDWQKSAREPSRCILRSQSYVLLRSHFHAPPSTVPQCHPISQCHAIPAIFFWLHSNVLLPSHFLGTFHLLATICITTPSPPTLWFPFLYFCFQICICFLHHHACFLESPLTAFSFNCFSVFNSFCSLTLSKFSFTFSLIQQFPFYLFYNFLHPPFSFFHHLPLLPLRNISFPLLVTSNEKSLLNLKSRN